MRNGCYCISKLKLCVFIKIYLERIDDFDLTIWNNNSIAMAGNFGRQTFQGTSFEICLMESHLSYPELHHPKIFPRCFDPLLWSTHL